MHTRRTFLQTTAALGAGAWCAVRAAADPSGPTGWKLGCYTRPWDKFDLATALDGIAEAGFAYAGLMTSNTKQWVLVRADTPEEDILGYRELADERGLRILSIYGDGFPVETSLDHGIRGLRRLIDHCALCRCPNLLLGGTDNPDLADRYYRVVRACCDHAAEQGVGLSIKPHGGTNATGPQCRALIEQVDHPSFRLWYDPGNIFYYSDGKLDPADDAATVNGLVAGMSIKDFRPPNDVLLTPGTGRVDFARVVRQLRNGGFTGGPLLVECLKPGTATEVTTEAKRARRFLENLLAP